MTGVNMRVKEGEQQGLRKRKWLCKQGSKPANYPKGKDNTTVKNEHA